VAGRGNRFVFDNRAEGMAITRGQSFGWYIGSFAEPLRDSREPKDWLGEGWAVLDRYALRMGRVPTI